MPKQVQVQIDQELFIDLCKYHLFEMQDDDRKARIHAGLQEKLDRAAARQRYSESLTQKKPTP